MDSVQLINYLNGATMMASLGAATFFWKFRKATSDSFFTWFAWAFFLFAVDRVALLCAGGLSEVSPAVYGIRCVGFLLIIVAVIRKNRRSSAG